MSGGRERPREENTTEYRLYARVSDASTTLANTMTELTEEDFIVESDCDYQNIWMSVVKEHMKTGLLMCKKGFKTRSGPYNKEEENRRSIYFIPGDVGLCFYNFNKSSQWYRYTRVLEPVKACEIPWNVDVIFTTPLGMTTSTDESCRCTCSS
jgi:hypothetical protein